jgi:glycosyltransferase involved in cell wall biosynthesis
VKVSLLSPVYNEAAYIRVAVESVRRQSHPDWEMLLVDDGSTDHTAELIRELAAADPRVRLVSAGTKLGKVAAFNRAFAASTGDVIALFAGDDTMPEDALAHRVAAFADVPPDEPAVAFFKIRTFSTDKRFDGITTPRGNAGSRSGGSITMTRALAAQVFPIDETLPAEDIYLGYAAEGLATRIVDRPEVVLNYRIHHGNSNPRQKSFEDMTAAIGDRHRAFSTLLRNERLHIKPAVQRRLALLAAAEQFRAEGRTAALLLNSRLPVGDRMAFASMSNPALFRIRTKFYSFFSGRRGR